MGAMLQEAIQALSSLCDGASTHDGQGFNKFDAAFGHSLAEHNRWTYKQARAAHVLLRKYKGQLATVGIDYDQIPTPRVEDYAQTANDAQFTDGRVIVRSQCKKHALISWQEFSRDLTEAVKDTVPGAKWSKAERAWKVRLSPVTIGGLAAFAEEHGFKNADQVEAMKEQFRIEACDRHDLSTSSFDEPLNIEARMTSPLRPFQRSGIRYAVRAKRCMIADEMGLGKTVQSIVATEWMDAYPCVCVVPAVVKEKWKREWNKWFSDKKFDVYIASGRKPENLRHPLYGPPSVIVINYDILQYWLKELKKIEPRCVIFDESHYLKNGKAQRSRAARALAKNTEYVYLLTGTPIENRTIEFASQLAIMDRLEELGGWKYFAYHWAGATDGQFGIEYGPGKNLEELNASLRSICYVRRLKHEVAKDLPDKARCVEEVEIDNWPEYSRVRDEFLSWIADKAITDEFLESIAGLDPDEKEWAIDTQRMSAAAKASMAEMLVQLGQLRKTVALGKINAARKWIENFRESGEKLIVFGWHRQIVEDLADLFNSPKIIGGMKSDDRQAAADKFMNDPNCQFIFCNLRAAGVGVDLYAASNVLFLELGWTPTVHDQAEARCVLEGQQVLTPKGWRAVEAIGVGDMVISHEGVPRKVEGVSHRKARGSHAHNSKDITEIRIRGWMDDIKLTSDHRVLMADGSWLEAGKIRPRDRIAMPKPVRGNRITRIHVSDECRLADRFETSEHDIFGDFYDKQRIKPATIQKTTKHSLPEFVSNDPFVFGFYIGDGCSTHNLTAFCGNKTTKVEALSRCESWIKGAGLNCSYYDSKSCESRQLSCYAGEMANFFKINFGANLRSKSVPEWVFKMSQEQRLEFLDGWIASDGYKRKDRNEISTASRTLAAQACRLVISVGLKPCVYFGKQANAYSVSWTDGVPQDLVVTSVVNRTCRRDDTVYDLTVEKDGTFVIGTAVVHNSHRIGQTKNVMSWYLLANQTVDDDMYELLEEKRRIVEAATDGHTNRADGSIVRELIKKLLSHNPSKGEQVEANEERLERPNM